MVWFDIEKTFDTFQKVSNMTEDIFQILVCLVGYVREKTESCNICKTLVIESADIAVIKLLCHDHGSCFCHAFRHKKTICKIIGTSCRNIPDGNITFFLHHSCDYFVKSAVTATAHDQVYLIMIFFGFLISISWFLRGIDDDFISTFIEYIYDIEQVCLDLAFACFGIENKEHFLFHSDSLLFSKSGSRTCCHKQDTDFCCLHPLWFYRSRISIYII